MTGMMEEDIENIVLETEMGYAETEDVDAGMKFTSPSGLQIETTGTTVYVESHDMYVHEVEILEGVGQGNRFLLNLDSAKKE